MMNKPLITSIFTLTLLGSTFSNATVIHSDRSAFEASLVSMTTDNYETGYDNFMSDSEMSAVRNETQYTSTGFSDLNIVSNSGNQYYCSGCNGSFLLDFTSSHYATGPGVYGVGFDFLNIDSLFGPTTEFFTAFVTYGDGSSENLALDITSGFSYDFFGVTSDLKISSIHVGAENGGIITDQNSYFALDNLTLGSDIEINIPNPSSIALIALGLLALRQRQPKR